MKEGCFLSSVNIWVLLMCCAVCTEDSAGKDNPSWFSLLVPALRRGTAANVASEPAPLGCQGRVSLGLSSRASHTFCPHILGTSLAGPERASAVNPHQEKYFGFSCGGSQSVWQGSSLAPALEWELVTWKVKRAALKWKPLCSDLCASVGECH